MVHDNDAKAKLNAIKADNARRRQMEEDRQRATAEKQAKFIHTVDQIFDPIFRAKAYALHSADDPVTLGQRAMVYRNPTLYYKPLWNQVLWQVSGHDVDEHQREMTRGHYVYLGLTENVLDHRAMRRIDRVLNDRYLRQVSPDEPYWGRVTRQEVVTGIRHGEGSSIEERRTLFPVEPISDRTDMIVQSFVEAMVRGAP